MGARDAFVLIVSADLDRHAFVRVQVIVLKLKS